MTVRKLTDTGDIVTSGTHFTSGIDEIAQTIVTRLKLFYGEYFRDTNDGTRWFQDVLGKGNTNGVADAEIRRRISQTNGVETLLEYNSSFDESTRKFSVVCSVLTQFGEVTIEESL